MLRPFLLVACFAGGLAAQRTLDEIVDLDTLHPRLKPFRNPDRNMVPPKELFDDLRRMQAIAKNATGSRVAFDAEGREVCDDPQWQQAFLACKDHIANQAGSLLQILEESKSGEDRGTAMYGAFYVEEPNDVFGLIARFPGEPMRANREAGYTRALAYLRVQWKKNLGKLGPDGEALPQYSLNLIPYAALLKCKDPIDQAQGLWFLREALQVRPQYVKACFEIVAPLLGPLLVAEDATLRREARAFLAAIDKQERAPKSETPSAAETKAWLAAVEHDVLPPIRRVHSGRWDLYPSQDRDEIVRVGREALANDSIGLMESGKDKTGMPFRGYRLMRLPAPLDRLPLPVDSIVTGVNGLSVMSSQRLLETLEKLLDGGKTGTLMIEYVQKTERKVVEVRIVPG